MKISTASSVNSTGSERSLLREGRARPGSAVAMSDLFRRDLAEDALGLEDHEHDEDREDDRLAPRLTEAHAVVQVLDDPDDEAAEDGAGEVADPAEHGGGERDEAQAEAGVPPGEPVGLQVEDAGRAGERPTEAERERDRAVD